MSRCPNASPPRARGGGSVRHHEALQPRLPGASDGTCSAWRFQEPQVCPATPVILLSWFDGIGTAAHVLHTLGARVVHHVAWEVDQECLALLGHHWPHAQLRGSFYDGAFELIAKQVSVGRRAAWRVLSLRSVRATYLESKERRHRARNTRVRSNF